MTAYQNFQPLSLAQMQLVGSGAKATCTVTLNAFGTWATGNRIVIPGIGSHTIKVDDDPGDIDVKDKTEAEAKAFIVNYLNTHAGATCTVAITGSTMTVTANAYGTALDGQDVSGTLLAAAGQMSGGVSAYDGKTAKSEVIWDKAFSGTSVVVSAATLGRALSSAKRYRWIVVLNAAAGNNIISLQPNGADAGCYCRFDSRLGNGDSATLWIGSQHPTDADPRIFEGHLGPRRLGLSMFQSEGRSAAAETQGQIIRANGATTTDFTSLTLAFLESSTGWLTLIEETL